MHEVTVDGVARRDFELWKRICNFFQAQAAALGNVERARENFRRVFEDAIHFVVILDEELCAIELHAASVVNRLASLNAEHHVLCVGVVFAEIVAVVGGDKRQTEIFFELEKAGMDAVLLLQTLILNFEIKILLAKNVGKSAGRGPGSVVIIFHQALGHLALQAAGKADQAAGMFGEKLLADARLVIKAVQRSLRGDLYQIAIALFIFGEHEQVVIRVALGGGAVIILFANIEFAADDRLHARMFGRIHEMDCAKNVAVVSHGHGRHTQLLYALAKFLDITGAIEQGVVGMQMQVNELGHESVALVYRSGVVGKRGSYWKDVLVCPSRRSLGMLQQAAGLGDEFGYFERLYQAGHAVFLQEGASIA